MNAKGKKGSNLSAPTGENKIPPVGSTNSNMGKPDQNYLFTNDKVFNEEVPKKKVLLIASPLLSRHLLYS